MKTIFGELIREMINLLVGAMLVICLLMTGYLIFANIYHTKETTYRYNVVIAEDETYKTFTNRVNRIDELVSKYDYSNIDSGSQKQYYENIIAIINNCNTAFKSSKLYASNNVTSVSTRDVYDYYGYYSGTIINKCMVMEMTKLDTINELNSFKDPYFDSAKDYIKLTREQLSKNTSSMISTLFQNSSYSYITDVSRDTIYNPTKMMFYQMLSNYDSSAKLVEKLAEYMATKLGGVA